MRFSILLLWIAGAGMAQTGPEARTVTVCSEHCGDIKLAQRVAARIFKEIGIRVDWRYGKQNCPANAIQITISNQTPAELMPGALAYAQPYEGTRIEIFYDRVMQAGSRHRAVIAGLLGHVLAHEIAHILQGVSRHSDEGVMQPRWGLTEILDMWRKPLTFAPLDAALIERGMNAKVARPVS